MAMEPRIRLIQPDHPFEAMAPGLQLRQVGARSLLAPGVADSHPLSAFGEFLG